MTEKTRNIWHKLAFAQVLRPSWFLLAGLAIVLASLPLVAKLGLNSEWTALLPANTPSVKDLKIAGNRAGGLSTLSIAIESKKKDVKGMQDFARALVPELEKLGSFGARSVDWNIAAYQNFVDAHRHLYADLTDLNRIHTSLGERLEYEHAKANPFYVDLGDEPPEGPKEIIDSMKEKEQDRRKDVDKYPGGFYVHKDRDLLAVFIRADIAGGDAAASEKLVSKVKEIVGALDPKKYGPDIQVNYGGDLVDVKDEHNAIARELVIATTLTIVLVMLSIYWLYRRVRSLVVLGVALFVPVVATFAIAELAVDYLNTSTAFLGSIVIGNGINPMIIWLARYFEERRKGGGVEFAVARTHQATWAATLTASSAAAVAYGSLVITDFRGFRDFGIIGAEGMVLCWLATMLLLPACAAIYERWRPLLTDETQAKAATRGSYGVIFWSLLSKKPKAILVVSSVAAVVSFGAAAFAIIHDPFEYNFDNLRSVRHSATPTSVINGRIGDIVGSTTRGMALVMLTPSLSETQRLEGALEDGSKKGRPWGTVRSIFDFLPQDQPEKIALLAKIRKHLIDARKYANDDEKKQIDEYIPPEHISQLSIADLPFAVARSFTERDGVRGRILLVESQPGRSTWDGRYLVEWANALREYRLSNGERPPLIGRATIFADILDAVWRDGPRVMLVSFLATLMMVFITFRSGSNLMLTMSALLLGVVWMAGTMAMYRMKINFLNFVAFPITFGIGVDYSVNMMRRIVEERAVPGVPMRSAIQASVQETGGAVVLCSLTTIVGYISLFTSANLALNSFGAAMTISEITCLVAATISLPAYLLLRHEANARARTADVSEHSIEHEGTAQSPTA